MAIIKRLSRSGVFRPDLLEGINRRNEKCNKLLEEAFESGPSNRRDDYVSALRSRNLELASLKSFLQSEKTKITFKRDDFYAELDDETANMLGKILDHAMTEIEAKIKQNTHILQNKLESLPSNPANSEFHSYFKKINDTPAKYSRGDKILSEYIEISKILNDASALLDKQISKMSRSTLNLEYLKNLKLEIEAHSEQLEEFFNYHEHIFRKSK